MNQGKICVSIRAETAEKFIEQIKRAESCADVIELRFDSLDKTQIEIALEKIRQIASAKTFLLTFRPKEQGGREDLSAAEREQFWDSDFGFFTNWADLETDLIETISRRFFEKTFCSYHDFNAVPENLNEIYEKLQATDADVLKIAVQAGEISDSIAVWKLLAKAKSDKKQIIPIAMGEAGKWTRILGLAHGAFLTYAALDAGRETAPGQLSARDLNEIYRVKELGEQTEIYGIVGNPVSHSLSPYIHNPAFKFYDLDAVFIPLEVKNLDEFIEKFVRAETREVELNFKGFSVTIPHKQAIIKHLDFIDETAKIIGAVNTVKIIDGKLHGFNTDAAGFIEPLKEIYGDLNGAKIAILGGGGAARACVYALERENAEAVIFARNLEKARNLADEFQIELKKLSTAEESKFDFSDFDILVNATPLGTKGELENETPATAERLENVKLVYDLIYNPPETCLLREARKAGVPTLGGLAMLVAQGVKQFEIWSGRDAPLEEINAWVGRKLQK